jgi:hypothetical protein
MMDSLEVVEGERPEVDASGSTTSPADSWLREAWDRVRQETALFARTFVAFVFHSVRSARSWQAGVGDFMNPLAFGASAAGVYWGVQAVLTALWPVPGSDAGDTLGSQLASAVGPYVHYGLLGATMHVGLRALGSRRRLPGSLGVAFFVGGSIGTITALLLSSATRWIANARDTNTLELGPGDPVAFWFLLAAVLSYGLVCLTMAMALMGLSRTAVWKTVLAGGFAIVVTAFLFGSVLPEGEYGWHPYIQIQGRQVSVGFQG